LNKGHHETMKQKYSEMITINNKQSELLNVVD